jgi:hypothetical protein
MDVIVHSLFLRRALLLVVPLMLGILELGHPFVVPGTNIYLALLPIVGWWTTLHMLQIPLFALFGLAAYLLVRDLEGRAAGVSRRMLALFIVVYPAFDAAVGVASGVFVGSSAGNGAAQTILEPGLQELFWGPITGLLAIIGSGSWLIGALAGATALFKAGAPRPAVAAMALAGLLLGISHVSPLGPLACGCFLVAAALIERREQEAMNALGASPPQAT